MVARLTSSSFKTAKGTVLYLYGISRAARKAEKVNARGVDGHAAVEPIKCGDLDCWISRVPRAEFGDELEKRMENLDWLAAAGLRHEQAVRSISRVADILPSRFGAIFLTEDSLRKHISATSGEIAANLKRVAGAEEWGVKVFAAAQPSRVEASSGKDYLKKKAAMLAPKEKRTPPEVAALAQVLAKLASESAHIGKVSSGQAGLVWQGAFLVPRSRKPAWESVIQQHTKKLSGRFRIETTGPWPPYSFASHAEHGR